MSDKEIQKYIKQVRKEGNADIKKHMERYVGALSEEFHGRVSGIGEQYADIKKTLHSHTQMIGSLMMNMEIVKSDIDIIKNDLKQKVDRSEFEALVRRVSVVERRVTK